MHPGQKLLCFPESLGPHVAAHDRALGDDVAARASILDDEANDISRPSLLSQHAHGTVGQRHGV